MHGSEELDAFVAHHTRKVSPDLTDAELSQAHDLFRVIDTNESGTLERDEIDAYYHKAWPEKTFPDWLVTEEEGHVTIDAWIQFLSDIKRADGTAALSAYLNGRELNFELKATLTSDPRSEYASPVGYGRRKPAGRSGSRSGSRSPSPIGSPRMVPVGGGAGREGEGGDVSVVAAMRENGELVQVVQQLLLSQPSIEVLPILNLES